MPDDTKELFATWKTSTRDNGAFVRYSSPRLASKIASAIDPPAGSARETPAPTWAESAFWTPLTTPLTVEKAQFRATALSQAYPSTRMVAGNALTNAARFRLKRRTTSVKLPPTLIV